jgi:hypothetical protein
VSIDVEVRVAGLDAKQRLLRRACWDADGLRDDLRGYVVKHLGDPAGC